VYDNVNFVSVSLWACPFQRDFNEMDCFGV